MRVDIRTADCLEEMHTMPGCSVDAIVCDPPYGMSFMGKEWDHGIPGRPFWRRALRVAKPGAPLLAFGGTRTHHRLMCAIEDAGWEIRDCLMWLYGSGFPKSLDVGKALDKAAGAIGHQSHGFNVAGGKEKFEKQTLSFRSDYGYKFDPATDAARQWSGWGTALKPAWEPIILARKPLDGTVAANVTKWEVGGLNVEGCRVGLEADSRLLKGGSYSGNRSGSNYKSMFNAGNGKVEYMEPPGRFPANLILDEESASLLDEQAGVRKSGLMRAGTQRGNREGWAGPMPERTGADTYGDTGGPSRFFYCAKASGADRNGGLEGMPKRAAGVHDDDGYREPGERRGDHTAPMPRENHHPTVKPRDLMRYLCTLVLPPERETPRVILDPFAGSGSTAIGAQLAGWDECILIERDPEYAEIARRRVAAV